MNTTEKLALVEATRVALLDSINRELESLKAKLLPNEPGNAPVFKVPTLADGADPRNKNGNNLTERGLEILFRAFDDEGGYNRASKLLGITQGAAKNRKQQWIAKGGKDRPRMMLDIDEKN